MERSEIKCVCIYASWSMNEFSPLERRVRLYSRAQLPRVQRSPTTSLSVFFPRVPRAFSRSESNFARLMTGA